MSAIEAQEEAKVVAPDQEQAFKLAKDKFLDESQWNYLKAEVLAFSGDPNVQNILNDFLDNLKEKRVLPHEIYFEAKITEIKQKLKSEQEEKFLAEDFFEFQDRARSEVTLQQELFNQTFSCVICYQLLDLKKRDNNIMCFSCSHSCCLSSYKKLQDQNECPNCKSYNVMVKQPPMNFNLISSTKFACRKCEGSFTLESL